MTKFLIRKIAGSFLFFFIYNSATAQNLIKKITGHVVDERREPVHLASASLIRSDGTLVSQSPTDMAGNFNIQISGSGKVFLKVTYVGFREYRSGLFNIADTTFHLIEMTPLSTTLKGVEVQAKKSIIELDGSTLVYNVTQSVTAQGGTALEALKRTPGVNVENESNLTLNGKSGVLVLIDGKQTYLSGKDLADFLKTLPASTIRSISVMNTPSAKYEASGTVGIINIKTSKLQVSGINSTVTTGLAYGLSLKQNEDIALNYRTKKINFFGNYSHFLGHYNYQYGTDRQQSGKSYDSRTDDLDDRKKLLGRLGLDYMLNSKNVIGILISGNYLYGGGATATKTKITIPPSDAVDQTLDAFNDYYGQQTKRYNLNLNYKYEDTSGHVLNVDADYGSFAKWNGNLQSNLYRDANGTALNETKYRILNTINIDLKGAKVDYTAKFLKGQFETGLKYSSVISGNDARFLHAGKAVDSLDNRRSNVFRYDERISSGYVNYKKDLAKWSVQAGLRMESTSSTGTLAYQIPSGDSTAIIKRNYTNLFPSFSLNFKPGPVHNLSFAYARRIERPAYQDLNPFVYLLDELSFWQGNPFLKPQLVNRFSFQYAYHSTTIVGLSYSHTSQFFANVVDTVQVEKIVIMTKNLGQQNNWSLTVNQLFKPAKWWDASLNGLVYYLQNDIVFDQYRSLNLQRLALRVALQQTLKLPFKTTGEAAFTYNSKRLSGANNISNPVSQLDLGLQKSVLSNKATLRLAVTDIYKGSQSRYTQSLPGLNATSYGYYEARQIKLNFTYRFAGSSVKAPRNRNSALDNESGRIK
ncbi:MAG: hypothetical protein EOP45_01880 [Sphingobacteriaceae bacterium]|nr:MAG: hypothetical protein EOP45_01880 [Sphingobacteriaceae bacterium]